MEKKENSKENKGGIITMEFHEAVRKRPGMYIGSAGASGGFYMMKGIFKELLELYPEAAFDFSVNKQDEISFSFSISENKISKFVSFFGKRASVRDKLFSLHVATAIADYFRFDIKSEKKNYSCEYVNGKLVSTETQTNFSSGEILKVEIKFSLATLIISFPTEDMWRFIQFLDQLAAMYPKAKFFIEDERGERKTSLTIQRSNGLLDLFFGNFSSHGYLRDNKFSKYIHFSGIKNNISYQILIDYAHYYFKGSKKMFFLNAELCGENCSHEIAVNESISEVVHEARAANENLIEKSFEERMLDSFNIYVSVFELERVNDLDYIGPTKHRFVSQSIHNDIKEVTKGQLKIHAANDKDFLWALVNLEV